jgi:hypothetical protein
VAGWRRHNAVHSALEDGGYAQLEHRWVIGLTAAAATVAVATFVVILVAQP